MKDKEFDGILDQIKNKIEHKKDSKIKMLSLEDFLAAYQLIQNLDQRKRNDVAVIDLHESLFKNMEIYSNRYQDHAFLNTYGSARNQQNK